MLDTSSHLENTNQNHSEIPFTSTGMARIKKNKQTKNQKITSVDEAMEKLGGMWNDAATVENSLAVSQMVRMICDPVIPLLGV